MSKRKRHYGGKGVGAGKSDVLLSERKKNPRLRKAQTPKREKSGAFSRFLWLLLVAISGAITGGVLALAWVGVKIVIEKFKAFS